MLKTKVKASSITNLTDARYFAAWEVEWMGFNFDAGADTYVPPNTMKAIREWIDGVQIVGEFNLHGAGEIVTAVDMLGLDAVQVGMFTGLATVIEMDLAVPVIKEIIIEETTSEDDILETLQDFSAHAQYFLLNFDKNGLSWEMLKKHSHIPAAFLKDTSQRHPVILSIDFQPADVPEILDTVQVAGLNLTGGEEERVGFKSFDELDEIFEQLEVLE